MRGELDRQVRTLHDLGYPELAGLSHGRLDELVAPLHDLLAGGGHVEGADGAPEVSADRFPVLLVVSSRLVPTVAAVERWSVRGRAGFTDMAAELAGYHPIDGVAVPPEPVYLLLDVDTGSETLDVRPDDALGMITRRGRTPLTIDEGVALVTHVPDVFDRRNAFQTLGSRADNRRIPSFWVSKGAPRLGWCWAGNPHSWLGAASASARVARQGRG